MKPNLHSAKQQFEAKLTEKQFHAAAVALGRKGGKAGKGKAKARTSEQARAAALARWEKERAQDDVAYRALMRGETHL